MPLEVLPDPASDGTPTGMAAQLAMQRELREETNRVTDLIDEIEWARKGIDDLEARAESGALRLQGVSADSVLAAARALDQTLIDIEMLLFDLRLTGGTAGQDSLRWPRRLYVKLISLAGYTSGSDDPPTDQAREVHQIYKDQLRTLLQRMDDVRSGELADFNRLLAAGGIAAIS